MKLWIGDDPEEGYEVLENPFVFPWENKEVYTEVKIKNVLHKIPHWRPEYNGVDGWWLFWREMYLVTEPGASIFVQVPYLKSDAAYSDPTAERFIHERVLYSLDKKFCEASVSMTPPEGLDFEVLVVSGNDVDQAMSLRSADTQAFAHRHYWNVVNILVAELKRV